MTAPVFFYPHKYLRDRHLDTIRNWPEEYALNRELADVRQPSHVSKQQALAPPKPRSWKQNIPLINIKRRPKNVPDSAITYAWGSIVRPGRFIIDLDNPYALTGYNVSALRLYRPILRHFLLSNDCQQIRCLSKACQSTLANTLGQDVADKADVCYPVVQSISRSPASGEECRFLFVSSQFDIKGGAALLRAFRRVRETCSNATLDMITYLPEKHRAEASAIQGLTIHNSDMPRQEIFERFMARADVLIHPTYADSFGMVLIEAMAHGLALIATDLYAIPEMLHNDRNGVLLRKSPLSIWNDVLANEYFSDIGGLRRAVEKLDTTDFENEIENAMLRFGEDTNFRTRSQNQSKEVFSEMMQAV